MKSKAYRAVDVNRIELANVLEGRDETVVHAGLDIGKETILATLRWSADDFERPWRVRNPFDVARLAELLKEVGRGRRLIVALEPTGTYGDALRQALERAGLAVHRVSPKSASDYAEVFDGGVPSQHDGKDAAVVADLSAQGRSWPWPMKTPSEAEQELAYQVEWLDGQRRQMMLWCGRVEALLSRHWPEATRILRLGSGTMLRCLAKYGGPRGVAASGVEEIQRWGGHYLKEEKAQALVASAREIPKCKGEMRMARKSLDELTSDHGANRGMGEAVGVATACVLWVELGDPSAYHCGSAYRKAMGLNLAERSSGQWQGKLKISKRGAAVVVSGGVALGEARAGAQLVLAPEGATSRRRQAGTDRRDAEIGVGVVPRRRPRRGVRSEPVVSEPDGGANRVRMRHRLDEGNR